MQLLDEVRQEVEAQRSASPIATCDMKKLSSKILYSLHENSSNYKAELWYIHVMSTRGRWMHRRSFVEFHMYFQAHNYS